MKKTEKKISPTIRTVCTRSSANSGSASQETHGLRRSNRGTQFKNSVSPASSTRKSGRLEKQAPSPASVNKKSSRMEKRKTPTPLGKSEKGKNASSQNCKGSDKSGTNGSTSAGIKKKNSVEGSTNEIKQHKPAMTGRAYRALFRRQPKKSEALGSADTQESDTDALPHTSSESKTLLVGETSLEKGTDFPLKIVRDAEEMVLGASFMEASRDESVRSPSSANLELQKVLLDETSLETEVNFPLKRKRDREEMMDASSTVANGDDHPMSSDGVTPSLSGCKNNTQPDICSQCEKKQKVNQHDSEELRDCSCTAQPGQESDYAAQGSGENGPGTSRDCEEPMQNMQQRGSYDGKLYQEYWVPVQLSNIQVEQYCETLLSKKLALTVSSKMPVGGPEDVLISVRKICDHPYVMDSSLQQRLFDKKLEPAEFLNEGINASGKLHLLDAMLTQIKRNGLKAVVFYQVVVGNILEDFVAQRFGLKSYERIERDVLLPKKLTALNSFNLESERFVLLLEMRACTQSIKLSRAEAFILFESSWNPSHEFKLLEKIRFDSLSESTKIFRLYSIYTVEEKALILARQNKPVENPNRSLSHVLLMWGASQLFDKLAHFHSNETPDSGVPFEKSIVDGVVEEFSSILSSKAGNKNKGKLCLLLEARHAQGTYSTDSTLFGEKNVKSYDEDCPNIFWTNLLSGKNPVWRYALVPPQRNRKKIHYLEDSEGSAQISNDEITKKRKKAADNITGIDERKACEKDPNGASEMPEVPALLSSPRSTSGFSSILNENSSISGIPENMLVSTGRGQIPYESQKSLHDVLKQEIPKLCTVLHLSEDWRRMVEKFLEYVIKNYRVYEEPTTTLQAFQIALIWVATLLVQQKLSHKESLACAKSKLAFSCSKDEAEYMYSILYCMKSRFLEDTQGLQMDYLGSSAKDLEETKSYIKKKCNKQAQNLLQKHEEQKMELAKLNDEKKEELENRKKIQASLTRIHARANPQSQVDDIKELDHDYDLKFDELKSEMDGRLKSLEKMHEAAKKKLTEYEACWIGRIEIWAQAKLSVLVKDNNNKHSGEMCSSNTSKNALDAHTFNDASDQADQDISRLPSSPGGNQPNPAAVLLGQNTEAATEFNSAESETVETVRFVASTQDEHVTCLLPSSPAGNQPDPAANIEDQQNVQTAAEPHTTGSDVMEIDDTAVSDQDARDIFPLPSSFVETQPNLAADIDGQNIATGMQILTDGSDAVLIGGAAISDQAAQDASHPPDSAVNSEGQNNSAVAEPQTNRSNACEVELAASAPQVMQSTFANNLGGLAHESIVYTSASVTAHVPSSLPNTATVQNTVQPAPQIPFPLFTDPFLYELEKMRREAENTRKTHDDKKSILKAELEKIQNEYQRKFQELDGEYNTRMMDIETNKKLISMSKLLATAFMTKCTPRNASLRGNVNSTHQLAQVAAQISAQRNYTSISRPMTAPVQPPPQPSVPSIPRPRSILCPMPQPRPPPPPLISNTAPSSSASLGHARVRLPAPHLQSSYISSSIPMATRPNSTVSLPQGTTTNESSRIGLQREEDDVVFVSDDE